MYVHTFHTNMGQGNTKVVGNVKDLEICDSSIATPWFVISPGFLNGVPEYVVIFRVEWIWCECGHPEHPYRLEFWSPLLSVFPIVAE